MIAFLRPSDIAYSSGDPVKAERLLGWKATKKMRPPVSRATGRIVARIAPDSLLNI